MSEEATNSLNLTNRLNLKIEKGDNHYILSLPNNCPIGEAYDACFAMLERIAKISQEALEKMKEAKLDEVEVGKEA